MRFQSDNSSISAAHVNFQSHLIRRFKQTEKHETDLVRLFFGCKTQGFFVDVGANDPFHKSQSYHLEQLGWRGILVEPLPDMAAYLRKSRRASVVESAISSNEHHGSRLPFRRAGTASALQTRSQTDPPETAQSDTFQVLCRTLDSVLEELDAPRAFDFLSIDVEGHEKEVLEGFSIHYWKPGLILLEDHLINLKNHLWLSKRSYKLILRTGINSWYVPREKAFSSTCFAKCQMYKKLLIGLPFRKIKHLLKQLGSKRNT